MSHDKLIFKFGHGGVIVDAVRTTGKLTLTQIKPPLNYLGNVQDGDLDDVEKLYSVTFTRKDNATSLKELIEKLSIISEGDVLEFEDVLLDFSKYEEESVAILIRGIRYALNPYWQLALAA